jgi:dTDP-4-dehydrorhamnose 3,5-epimerase
MGSLSLENIMVTPLRIIPTQGGIVMHVLKDSDEAFAGFGEAYFSRVECGAIKSWRKHTQMTMNLVVPVGKVKFVFTMDGTEYREIEIGEDSYQRITVPSGFWCSFACISAVPALVLDVANIAHDPAEVERREIQDFSYQWQC